MKNNELQKKKSAAPVLGAVAAVLAAAGALLYARIARQKDKSEKVEGETNGTASR